jgi:hypothetical protein
MKFSSLADLPARVIPVVWVSSYRAIEISMAVEAAGGPAALTKSMLLEGGDLYQSFDTSILSMKFVIDMVAIIRSAQSATEQEADCQLLIDVIKWGITDAANMTMDQRVRARVLTRPDEEYDSPVPDEIISDDGVIPQPTPGTKKGSKGIKWLKSLFLGNIERTSKSGRTSESDKIFERLHRFLNDEQAQNDQLPEQYRSSVEGGPNCDAVAGAVGEFGRHYRNPIPVNGPIGEILYLSNLIVNKGTPIMFHRIGSKDGVDAFEVVSFDGSVWDILFLHLYHPRKSRKAPIGYMIAQGQDRQDLFRGTNEFVDGFPHHIQDAVREVFQQWVGIPMPNPELRRVLETTSFNRPTNHQTKLTETLQYLDVKEM